MDFYSLKLKCSLAKERHCTSEYHHYPATAFSTCQIHLQFCQLPPSTQIMPPWVGIPYEVALPMFRPGRRKVPIRTFLISNLKKMERGQQDGSVINFCAQLSCSEGEKKS